MRDIDEGVMRQHLATARLIVTALIAGVLVFLTIGVFMVEIRRPGGPPMPQGNQKVVTLVSMALFLIQVPLSFVLPRVMLRGSLKKLAAERRQPAEDLPRLLGLRQASLILGMALLEGVAFLCCVGYLTEGHRIALVLAGFVLLLMLFRFPSETGTRLWLEMRWSELEDLRAQTSGEE